jgi:lysophospholipase L1-like esterase
MSVIASFSLHPKESPMSPSAFRCSHTAAVALLMLLGVCLHAGDATLHIMPLGDSITMAAPGYRAPLFKLLKEAGHHVDFVGTMTDKPKGDSDYDLDHEGHGGFTVGPGPSAADKWTGGKGSLYANLDDWLAPGNAKTKQVDIVLLHIGVNDFANIKDLDPGYKLETDFAVRYAGLLDKILSLRPKAAIICSTVIPGGNPDINAVFSVGPFDKVNPQLKAVAAARSSHVFLYDGAKLQGTGLKWEPSDWNKGDVIHPNDQGHAKFAKFWAAAIEDVVKKGLPKTAYAPKGN